MKRTIQSGHNVNKIEVTWNFSAICLKELNSKTPVLSTPGVTAEQDPWKDRQCHSSWEKPAPVIFSDTFRSLNHCRITGEGRFIGCAQLLCMWIMSHIRPPPSFRFPEIKFTSYIFSTSNPLKEFAVANWDVESPGKAQWIRTLKSLTDDQVIWRAAWTPQTPVLYRCGNYPWVILLILPHSPSKMTHG